MHTNYPCSGFDAAVSYLCIQIENRMNETHKPFDDVLSWVLFHKDDPRSLAQGCSSLQW